MNLRIFVSCDDDIRLYRRVSRDVLERGREVTGVIYQYNRFVKPAFDNFIKPSARHANIIVPGGHDNSVAINFIVKNLRSEIAKFEDLRDKVKQNIFHTDILDSRWLNIPQGDAVGERADRIIYLVDDSAKTECIKLFSLLNEKFSKTLYQLVIHRFCTYAVKLMKRSNKSHKPEQYEIRHFSNMNLEGQDDDSSDEDEGTMEAKKQKTNDVLALIVTFLHSGNLESLREKLLKESEGEKRSSIYILAIFTEMECLTNLTKEFKNINIVNILSVVSMEKLLHNLTEMCKVKFDFEANEEMVKQLLNMCEREIRKIEKNQE